jgi:hypothetical protein
MPSKIQRAMDAPLRNLPFARGGRDSALGPFSFRNSWLDNPSLTVMLPHQICTALNPYVSYNIPHYRPYRPQENAYGPQNPCYGPHNPHYSLPNTSYAPPNTLLPSSAHSLRPSLSSSCTPAILHWNHARISLSRINAQRPTNLVIKGHFVDHSYGVKIFKVRPSSSPIHSECFHIAYWFQTHQESKSSPFTERACASVQ